MGENERAQSENEHERAQPKCDGLCVTSADIGVPGYGVAYPHPGCPLHAPDEVCQCGMPDRCLSPTHGQIDYVEALFIRHSQNPIVQKAANRG